ncbi:MAG: hypothetical protein HY834_08380 [Devosia nanyangense]|uniref:Uncharacterized protein n=1 Tax=Devosia nanyangense TaxID=1228055 RepID=A0A933L220_9HYPH|nr:hypothetical protein [Devosia nanyangense]
MNRIAAALLITVAVLALNAGTLREAFAGEAMARLPAALPASLMPAPVRSTKVLSLLLILEALRQAPVSLDPQKV